MNKDKKKGKGAKTSKEKVRVVFHSSTPKANRKAGICPKCGNERLEYGCIILSRPLASYPYICRECNTVGIEKYKLAFVEQIIDEEEEE